MNNQTKIETKISILDWGIVMATIVLLIMVFIPGSIWIEEDMYRTQSRDRMSDIAFAQEFYKELTGSYTDNGEELFSLVEAAMDSLISDSMFLDKQEIRLNGKFYSVDVPKGFEVQVDTTFCDPIIRLAIVIDTTFTIGMRNDETNNVDTLYVNAMHIKRYTADTLYVETYDFITSTRKEKQTDYLSQKYHLTQELLLCPLTDQLYIFEIENIDGSEIFTVKSPVPVDYTEPRFGIFKFESGAHGNVRDGENSWAGN